MSQAIALWHGYWPGHVSNRKNWFILCKEDFKDQPWNGHPPFGKNGNKQLTVDLPFLSEEEAMQMAIMYHDPDFSFHEGNDEIVEEYPA